jgi:hypothetical protein
MRNPMPLRWIEEAEARQVLALARDEAPLPTPPVAPRRWAEGLRRWSRLLLARPQQVGQRGNSVESAEIVNEV